MWIFYLTRDNQLVKKPLTQSRDKSYSVSIPERHFILCAFIAENIVRIPTSYLSPEECFFQEYYPAHVNVSAMKIEAFRGENETFTFNL